MPIPSKRKASDMESTDPGTKAKKTKVDTAFEETQDDTEKVTVLIGDQTFQVDKTLLTERSKYFRDMLESQSGTEPIKFADTEAKYFAIYTEYLKMKRNAQILGQAWGHLRALFRLSESLSDTTFHNKIVSAMVTTSEKKRDRPFHGVMRSLYNTSAPTSPIRRLMLKLTMRGYDNLEASDYQYEDEYSVAVGRKLVAPGYERDRMRLGEVKAAKYFDTEKKRARRVAKEAKASRACSEKT